MISKRMVQDKIEEYEKRGLMERNTSIKTLKKNFMDKARHNIETAKMLFEISSDPKAKDLLKL